MKAWFSSLFSPPPTPHPFSKRKMDVVMAVDVVVPAEPVDVQSVKWGANKVVKAVVTQTTDSIEWETHNKTARQLKTSELDNYDMQIIRERKISVNNYKLVKPYVIAGWTNKEVATVLNASLSWVERIAPRVKDAVRLRTTPIV